MPRGSAIASGPRTIVVLPGRRSTTLKSPIDPGLTAPGTQDTDQGPFIDRPMPPLRLLRLEAL